MAFSSALSLASWSGAQLLQAGLAAFGLLVLVMVTSAVRTWYDMRHIPGPPTARFSYFWLVRAMWSGRMPYILSAAQAKYGPVVRIGPSDVAIYSAEELWRINGVRSAYGRGGWYSTMKIDVDGHHIFSEPDKAKHDHRKALLAGGYAGRGNMDIEADVNAQMAIFVNLLRTKYLSKGGDTKPCDFAKLARYYTVDVTTLSGLGEAWGNLEHDRDTYDYLKEGDQFNPVVYTMSMSPTLRRFLTSDSVLRLAGPKPTDEKGMGRFLGVAEKTVKDRVEKGEHITQKSHDNMADTWLKNGLSPKQVYLEITLLLPAGAETATTIIRGTFLHLLTAPTVYRKFKDEIRHGIQQGRISSPITLEEAKKLPYLQAVIAEGIRMVPSGIIGFPKRVPPGGDTVCGHFLPGGTDIWWNIPGMMRDRSVFGEDADMFRPERFTEADADRKAWLYKHIDLLFGFGRWQCPGKTVALLELNKVFVELLRNFDFQLVNPEKPWHIKGYVTWHITDFLVRVTEGRLD